MTSPETMRLQHEADLSRRQLASDLDELQRRLSPEAVVQRCLTYVRDGELNAFGRNMGRQVRDNPMPVALTAVGVAWLMLGRGANGTRRGGGYDAGRSYAGYERHESYPGYDDYVDSTDDGEERQALLDRVSAAGAAVVRTAEETAEAFQERVQAARGRILGVQRSGEETFAAFTQRVEDAVANMSSRVSDGGRRAAGAASSVAATGQHLFERGRARMHDLRDGVTEMAHWVDDTSNRVGGTFRESPLLAGAVGLAVGMVAAMMLPTMRGERRLAGDVGDRIGRNMSSAAEELRDSAGRVVHAMASSGAAAAQEEVERKMPEVDEASGHEGGRDKPSSGVTGHDRPSTPPSSPAAGPR